MALSRCLPLTVKDGEEVLAGLLVSQPLARRMLAKARGAAPSIDRLGNSADEPATAWAATASTASSSISTSSGEARCRRARLGLGRRRDRSAGRHRSRGEHKGPRR